ncbi:MAG TPA: heparinase II/III family protein [Mycobacteriales bacterium]|nr:heparinase II/III family protein [Mycobacteriales bacterium]
MTSRLRTEDELELLRKRSADPEFAPAWDALRKRADTALEEALWPVAKGAGWGHGYYCPEHVEVLEFDPQRPDRHRCPVDGKDYTGPEFDGGWRCLLNGRILDGLSSSALVWRATGERRYRDHVLAVLTEYARIYSGLPQNGIHVGKGRVTGQSLEEAVWGIGIARAYDDIRESVPDPGLLENDLLRPIGRQVHSQLLGKVHNIECWHLAALATIGAVLDDAEFLTPATTGEFALPAQLREGILDDGWWAEGSPNYHFYMASAVMHAMTALRNRHPEYLTDLGFRKMFTAPLTMLRPDLSLPALNDGWLSIALPDGIAVGAALYEQAWALWHDPADAAFLRLLYDRGVPRLSETALTSGPDLHEHEPAVPPLRRVHPSSGYAVLADPDRFLLVKYGLHGGGHGHPDKLQIDLHAFGTRLAPDAGSPAYNSPLQGPWFRQTISHNTVVLGTESQPEAEGRLRHYLEAGLVDAEVSWPRDPEPLRRPGSWLKEPRRKHVPAYAGAAIRRVVISARAGYYLDLILVTAPSAVPIDLAWHHRGTLVTPALEPADWAPPNEAYAFLQDVRSVPGSPWQLEWRVENAGTRLWGLDPEGATVLSARSPSNPPAETQSTLLRRTHGTAACFATVIEPVAGSGTVRRVHWGQNGLSAGGELSVDIETAAGTEHWEIEPGPATTVEADGPRYRVRLDGADGR